MKIIDHPGEPEREILTGMIVSDSVLGRVAAAWGDTTGPFTSDVWNLVGKWCVRHYRRYAKAPGKDIASYYRVWLEGKEGSPDAPRIEMLLDQLSEDFARTKKSISPDYLIDLANRTFRQNKLKRVLEAASDNLLAGNLEEAESMVTQYASLDLSTASGIDLFIDREQMLSTYAADSYDPLVVYPGGLGEFYGHLLGRDQLIAFMAPEKGQKSWLMLDIAVQAMYSRRRVAYFQVGDLSERQIKDRFLVRAARRPSMSTHDDGVTWPCTARIPVAIDPPGAGDDHANVRFKTKTFDAPLYHHAGWDGEVYDHVLGKVKSRKSYFRLKCYPTKTATALDVRSAIESYALGGFVPDVVIIDYSDILAPINRKEDPIHQIKTTWEELRKISQIYHCLLVTATQVNASSYGKKTLDRSNFGGNHLKFAEVTGMIGINITAEEKEHQLLRLNWVMRREGQFNSRRCVHVAGCLALSSPCVLSVYPKWGSSGGSDKK